MKRLLLPAAVALVLAGCSSEIDELKSFVRDSDKGLPRTHRAAAGRSSPSSRSPTKASTFPTRSSRASSPRPRKARAAASHRT